MNNVDLLLDICCILHKAILSTGSHHPQLLKHSQRDWSAHWSEDIGKLAAIVKKATDQQDPLMASKTVIQHLFAPEFLSTPQYDQLVSILTQRIQSAQAQKEDPNGDMAALLLDADNMSIDANHEAWIEQETQSRLSMKVAFANWKNKKIDGTLHRRGYELIHIPAGQDNTDGKMITYGERIHKINPNVSKVFICSNDKIFFNLANNLLHSGLEVFMINHHAKKITLKNIRTSEVWEQLPDPISESQFIAQVEGIVRALQEKDKQPWISLSKLAQMYHVKYERLIEEVVNTLNDSEVNVTDILRHYPDKFAINIVSQDVFVNLFEINSEQLFIEEIYRLIKKYGNGKSIPLSDLSSAYNTEYRTQIKDKLKKLGKPSALKAYLLSRKDIFSLMETSQFIWQVELR